MGPFVSDPLTSAEKIIHVFVLAEWKVESRARRKGGPWEKERSQSLPKMKSEKMIGKLMPSPVLSPRLSVYLLLVILVNSREGSWYF